MPSRLVVPVVLAALVALAGVQLQAQQPPQEFQPTIGQPGKDVIWVPTPDELVETMLDLAKITPEDYVIDLGSGDGRNVIAAAKRGARALGVEFNKDLVEFSKRAATAAGVADRARFVEGDMFEADISRADVLALFLLPMQMAELSPKFLNLKAGSRIVSNTFGIEGWEPDVTERITIGECETWCTALLWYVPAKAAGTWRLQGGELTLTQSFQMVTGTLRTGSTVVPVEGKLRGEEIAFTAGGVAYAGRVRGGTIDGTAEPGRPSPWRASRIRR